MRFRPVIAFCQCLLGGASIFLIGVAAPRANAFDIIFNYSFDEIANGGINFFGSAGSAQRTALEAAASFFEGIIQDDLEAIQPGGGNTWDSIIFNPNDTSSFAVQTDLSIAADSILIFAAGQDKGFLGPLGEAGAGGIASAGGSGDWFDTLTYRGESGIITPSINGDDTEVAPWGGSLSINANSGINWNFDVGSGPSASEDDFYSVALHEIGHVLGLSLADSFDALVNGSNEFTGPNAVATFGGNVPVSSSSDHHWQAGVTSTIYGTSTSQEAIMTPSLTTGDRRLFTEVDVAALDDIGWDVAPEPGSGLMVALGGVALMLRRPRRQAAA